MALAAVGLLYAARPLGDQPGVCIAGCFQGARGVDRGRLAGGFGRGLVDGGRRFVHGHGCLHSRRVLSGSSYRHQIEVDIEPFKGILLGLFFLAVGMSLDLALVLQQWAFIAVVLLGYMAVKALGIYTVARLFGSNRRIAVSRMTLFAPGVSLRLCCSQPPKPRA